MELVAVVPQRAGVWSVHIVIQGPRDSNVLINQIWGIPNMTIHVILQTLDIHVPSRDSCALGSVSDMTYHSGIAQTHSVIAIAVDYKSYNFKSTINVGVHGTLQILCFAVRSLNVINDLFPRPIISTSISSLSLSDASSFPPARDGTRRDGYGVDKIAIFISLIHRTIGRNDIAIPFVIVSTNAWGVAAFIDVTILIQTSSSTYVWSLYEIRKSKKSKWPTLQHL